MAVKTPLKWVGSKARLMPQLLPHLPNGNRLVEPFAGSCAVMMNTDYDEYLIADVNPDLIHLYQCIQLDEEQFIQDAKPFFESSNEECLYYHLRSSFNIEPEWQWRAAMFLYLNRHCYGGICRYNQRGHFNVPYGRYKKPYFPEAEIRAFAEKAKRATFICASFEETLQMVRTGDVVYCDPPYIPVNPTANFTQYHTDGFTQDDQFRLASLLQQLPTGASVIASNSDTHEAHNLYSRFTRHTLKAPRSIGAAKGGESSVGELLAVSGGAA
jgi:DNA adenine methylase